MPTLFKKMQRRGLVVWIIVFTALTFYGIHRNTDLANQGVIAHSALCSFKMDLQSRIVNSETFLRNHPQGIPGLATRTDILTSIKNQKLTLASLSELHC